MLFSLPNPASRQMSYWMPSFFAERAELDKFSASTGEYYAPPEAEQVVLGMGATGATYALFRPYAGHIVALIVFGMEHVILLVVVFLEFYLADLPKWIRDADARRKYKHEQQLLEQLRAAQREATREGPASSLTDLVAEEKSPQSLRHRVK